MKIITHPHNTLRRLFESVLGRHTTYMCLKCSCVSLVSN